MRGGKGKSGLLPNSLRIISSCLKTVSSNAGTVASTVRSAGASVAASIAVSPEDVRDQVLWVGFDKLEICPGSFKHVLLVGYSNGFQVVDVEDASNVCELVSKRDGPVTFLQIQPVPAKSEGSEGFRASHPLLLVVAGDETNGSGAVQGGRLSAFVRESASDSQSGNCIYNTPTVVRFYSLKSHSYVHVLRFRSAVYIVRCSPRIVAVSLAAQIYCFDAVTLENKFSVLTFPLQGSAGVNIGYGPMAVGPRWLAYSPNNPLLSNTGRLSPQNLTPSPGISPSTSPGNGTLVARYAMESSKQLAAGLLNLGDMGYKTLSKYCHEFIPDGSSSPSSPNSSRRIVKVPSSIHPNEAENAGMVVVKDFITKDVISQFRAHTSPISALCFDPSGTLLVTASVQGHSINVFRIMPGLMPNGSSSGRYDWTSSHTHLYKLYRGITSAIIQDICFSDYSQWIAIVSSRGTCHIFVLSPFGGDSSLQQNTDIDGPSLIPNYLPPWWTTSTTMMDKQCFPPPLTLSVVSRIKGGSLGWLNTVSNVAASATGKTTAPSGAIAAVFHNSIYRGSSPVHLKSKSLEHLLVYSPSGHVIQHELQPASSVESSDSSSRNGSSSSLQLQDEELHVNAEPVQWWDVCRRANWLEREQTMSRTKYANQQNIETVMDTFDSDHSGSSYSISYTNNMAGKEFVKPHERHNWYLSNAEVQINLERIPIWQKPQICFYVMESLQADARSGNDCSGGEVEIEKLLVHEVEIRRKDLVPALEQFRSSQADWIDRRLVGAHHGPHVEFNKANKLIQETGAIHSQSALVASGLTVGFPWTAASQLDSDGVRSQSVESIPQKSAHSSNLSHSGLENGNIISLSGFTSARIPRKFSDEECASLHSEHTNNNSPMDECVINGANELVIAATHSSNNGFIGELSSASIEQNGTADSGCPVEFTKYFHEGYCKVSELDDCRDSTDAVTDVDSSSSHCEREKPDEEDGDNDDMLGGVFDFSEEG